MERVTPTPIYKKDKIWKDVPCPNCGVGPVNVGDTLCVNCGMPVANPDDYPRGQFGRIKLKVFESPPEELQLVSLDIDRHSITMLVRCNHADRELASRLQGKRFLVYRPMGDDIPMNRCPPLWFGIIDEAIVTAYDDGSALSLFGKDILGKVYSNI